MSIIWRKILKNKKMSTLKSPYARQPKCKVTVSIYQITSGYFLLLFTAMVIVVVAFLAEIDKKIIMETMKC